MVVVKFTKDFANKKKGDLFECDNLLASQLVNKDKVAEIVDKETLKKSLNVIVSELATANESLATAKEDLKKANAEIKKLGKK